MQKRKVFMITGAGFKNKGAQSMLFVTVSELRARFENCRIFFVTNEKGEGLSALNFDVVRADNNDWLYAGGGLRALEGVIKKAAKSIINRKNLLKDMVKFKRCLQQTDAVLDVSGYNLSSQWSYKINTGYLNRIRASKKHGIPVFLMPQSFGPFDYKENKCRLYKGIKEYLSYPVRVFAREQDGFKEMTEQFGLSNVVLSPDLVLQNKKIQMETIFIENHLLKNPKVDNTKKNVVVIPNGKNFVHGDRDVLIEIYRKLISFLDSENFCVCLFGHSSSQEDNEAIHAIYDSLENKDRVRVIEDELDCLEYDNWVRNFDFIIASRYHSIVHAYKRGVPAIILGWAEKYHELAKLFGQRNVVFDVRKEINIQELESAIITLWQNKLEAERQIRNALDAIQKDSCFDIVSEFFAENVNEEK